MTNPNSSSGSTFFDFRIEWNFGAAPKTGSFIHGAERNEASLSQSAGLSLDEFFATIIDESEKIDPSSLAGPSKEENLYNAINHLYRRHMAQLINSNMRDPPPTFVSGNGTTFVHVKTWIQSQNFVQQFQLFVWFRIKQVKSFFRYRLRSQLRLRLSPIFLLRYVTCYLSIPVLSRARWLFSRVVIFAITPNRAHVNVAARDEVTTSLHQNRRMIRFLLLIMMSMTIYDVSEHRS